MCHDVRGCCYEKRDNKDRRRKRNNKALAQLSELVFKIE